MNLHRVTIAEADDGIRLDRWFKRHLPGLPHALLEKQLRKGDIRLSGKKAKSSDRIAAGQELAYPEFTVAQAQARKRERAPLNAEDTAYIQTLVLYKDPDIIAINKPFGLPVQGGSKISRSVDDLLGGLQFDQSERPKLVHRLDRDTSGVLVLARSAKAAAKLARAFSGKDIEKTYWALVGGAPFESTGLIDYKLVKANLGEESYERVTVDDEDGKYARTEYRVIEALARRFAFMELKPQTGRTHQLRVHMQAIGCPIVGDRKYGGSIEPGSALDVQNKLHLHARRLVIPAFVLGRKIDVMAPLPDHMQKSFRSLGIEVPKK